MAKPRFGTLCAVVFALLAFAPACSDSGQSNGGGSGGMTGTGGTGGTGGGTGMVTQATNPGDLLVVEPASGSILGVSPDGTVFTVLSAAAIRSTTGASAVDLDRKGIAISPTSATAYFCEQESGAVIALPVGGPSTVAASRAEFVAATNGAEDHFNLGIAMTTDGFLYVTSNHNGPGEEGGGPGRDRIFQVDPSGGVSVFRTETQVEAELPMVNSYDTEQAIVAGDGGSFFVTNTNSGDPPGVLQFSSGGPSILAAGAAFSGDYTLRAMARAPDGDVIVWDDGADAYLRVASNSVTELISTAVIDSVAMGADPDGGMAFADDGTLYVAEDELGILRFPPPYTSGSVFVDAAAIVAVTGEPMSSFALDGGLAFHPSP